jgi:hypothetical protein
LQVGVEGKAVLPEGKDEAGRGVRRPGIDKDEGEGPAEKGQTGAEAVSRAGRDVGRDLCDAAEARLDPGSLSKEEGVDLGDRCPGGCLDDQGSVLLDDQGRVLRRLSLGTIVLLSTFTYYFFDTEV